MFPSLRRQRETLRFTAFYVCVFIFSIHLSVCTCWIRIVRIPPPQKVELKLSNMFSQLHVSLLPHIKF